MSRQLNISWPDVLDLRVVATLAGFVNQKWGVDVSFRAADGTLIDGAAGLLYAPGPSLCALLRAAPGALGRACRRIDLGGKRRGDTREVVTPRGAITAYGCPLGLTELQAPVVVTDACLASVTAGGYLTIDSEPAAIARRLTSLGLAEQELELSLDSIPRLTPADEVALAEILLLLVHEITRFQSEIGGRDRRARTCPSTTRYCYDDIIGKSAPMESVYQLLDKVIDSESTVLIHGENGTGKELVAKAIHYNSARQERRFVVQNCSAFNDNLLDSELFGHKKGAFTGAISDKMGLFEVADGSTFFLDEIGDMSPALQVKLLRVLQEGTFIPVGDTQPKTVDVRIIAATNRDLKQMVRKGEFREDLYYRINVINIRIPPLRERREDVTLLVEHFLEKQTKGNRSQLKKLSKACLQRLAEYSWPGNVRELENEIERMVVLAGDEKLVGEELLSSRIRRPPSGPQGDNAREPDGLPEAIQALERTMIYDVLKRNHWNKTRAAQELRISRRNLIRKVNKYELDQRDGPR